MGFHPSSHNNPERLRVSLKKESEWFHYFYKRFMKTMGKLPT